MSGMTSLGKSARCRSGNSSPKTVGPRRIPASTSPITRGWRKCATAAPIRRAKSMTTTTARKKAATSSVKSRCLLATTFSGAVAVPPAGTLSVRSRLTACPVTGRTLLSRHMTRPAIGPSR